MATKRKDPKDYVKTGRPTLYNTKIADEICAAIASSELGLAHLVQHNPHWPARQNIFLWLVEHPEFRDKYDRAKENQAEVIVEYTQEILNEQHKSIDEETGKVRLDVPLMKLKIDTLKWHAGKLKPKKYGELKNKEDENAENNRALKDDCERRYQDIK